MLLVMTKQDGTKIRAARRARVRMIRARVVGGSVALFLAVWSLIAVVLITGHDPALARKTAVASTAADTTAAAADTTTTAANTTTTSAASGTTGSSAGSSTDTSSTNTSTTSTGSGSTGATSSSTGSGSSAGSAVTSSQS